MLPGEIRQPEEVELYDDNENGFYLQLTNCHEQRIFIAKWKESISA
ncbi:hypothetical protein JZ788_09500 [Enterobacteriaceae bacterium YMB-R21]|uniref:Uncharacterized protein n=1 Tax=Tenebrionicola larvae TaxID=2815733 RepID=A0A949V197_9ENTR|nr:hypothetical protein [Tenebrionicola larvae]